MKSRVILLAVLAIVALAGVAPLAADPVVHRGIDAFTTVANGETFYDFARDPIPAGFFCKSSKPFKGRVALKGLPLATGAPGQLGGRDTVIERLDDAVFDATGTATTRIQFKALSLVSMEPIRTGCGAFHVYVSLADTQRVTNMQIFRTQEAGGTFFAPLAVNARMSFIPVRATKGARKLELTGSFTFPATSKPWSFAAGAEAKRIGSVMVDTNGDLVPDTRVAGTSNFAPGWTPGESDRTPLDKACFQCEPASCHTDAATGKQHCTGPVRVCQPAVCP